MAASRGGSVKDIPTRGGVESSTQGNFKGSPRPGWRLTVDEVVKDLGNPMRLLVDSRTPERYRGIGETLDPVGGHIPGAANYFFQQNLTAEKTFKSPDDLKTQWSAIVKGHDPRDVVVYCGSGVTACHNLLALEHAGIQGVKIYPGSWSRVELGRHSSHGHHRRLSLSAEARGEGGHQRNARGFRQRSHEEDDPHLSLHPGHPGRAGRGPGRPDLPLGAQ